MCTVTVLPWLGLALGGYQRGLKGLLEPGPACPVADQGRSFPGLTFPGCSSLGPRCRGHLSFMMMYNTLFCKQDFHAVLVLKSRVRSRFDSLLQHQKPKPPTRFQKPSVLPHISPMCPAKQSKSVTSKLSALHSNGNIEPPKFCCIFKVTGI